MLHHGKPAPVPTILRPVAGIKFEMSNCVHKIVKFLSLNICYVIYDLLWIKYWLMWFENLLVFILFIFKKRTNISGIQVVFSVRWMARSGLYRDREWFRQCKYVALQSSTALAQAVL